MGVTSLATMSDAVSPGARGGSAADSTPVPHGCEREPARATRRLLGDNYRDPLNAADVGRALGLHPNDATTLFRRGLGVGM
jgi:AraC-like DNA-binding protein